MNPLRKLAIVFAAVIVFAVAGAQAAMACGCHNEGRHKPKTTVIRVIKNREMIRVYDRNRGHVEKRIEKKHKTVIHRTIHRTIRRHR